MKESKNKKALAEVVAEKMNVTKKDALVMVDIIFDEIKNTLKEDGKVDISGFGKFEVKHKEARKGINPSTMEPVMIAAKNVPTFKPAKAFKESL
ncbi:MAG: HU family DNA-binding protein [Erysipelotrichaceae bacterium]|nr:HU family DNA-binding protein [Erysipelotrichaceae bacterium]